MERIGHELIEQRPMLSLDEIKRRRADIPMSPGVYAWFFDTALGFGTEPLFRREGRFLLYAGIGDPLRQRLLNHCRNSSGSSTMRRSLGVLLTTELGLQARRYGVRQKLAFERASELLLTDWLAAHARVVWVPFEQAGELERLLISHYRPPLCLDGNAGEHATYLKRLRAQSRAG
ncbi:MAG: hypothetical protein J0J10_18020 [Bosea sp.]|uniref:GIY-YIG nuclease family protein n=1 Tax=Bosea sp. (in: a-proteobacteria) TaxID=1871050 RepID=UPI001AD4E29C|nr:hypothetical protein [Bosea sp. (in: a-proteobacteria)]MBN9470666.1 hypothetical protein [Bosea sp. (in: a-proteobacteria)]